MKRLCLTLLMILSAAVTMAAELTVQNGARTLDSKIRENDPYGPYNFGGTTSLATVNSAGMRQRFFLQFTALDTVGPGVTFQEFHITLNCFFITGANTVIAVYPNARPYLEGTATGAAQAGMCAWNAWYYNSDGGLDSAWTSAGCNSANDAWTPNRQDGSGYDRAATPFATATFSATGAVTWDFNAAGVAWIQACYDGEIPADQQSLVFMETSTVGLSQFYSSEETTVTNRPAYRAVFDLASSGSRRIMMMHEE